MVAVVSFKRRQRSWADDKVKPSARGCADDLVNTDDHLCCVDPNCVDGTTSTAANGSFLVILANTGCGS
jgi:hypothetical protein